jgi:hypothetical protein
VGIKRVRLSARLPIVAGFILRDALECGRDSLVRTDESTPEHQHINADGDYRTGIDEIENTSKGRHHFVLGV